MLNYETGGEILVNYYENIKDYLIRNEINHRVKDYSKNKSDLETYYNVGKEIVIAQGGEERAKYGDSLIKKYSIRLTNELGKGYTITALKRMRSFFLIIQKGATLSHQLSWSHYVEIITLNDIDKHIKEINHNKTIGIIICKHDNKLVLEYCSDKRIISTTYVLSKICC